WRSVQCELGPDFCFAGTATCAWRNRRHPIGPHYVYASGPLPPLVAIWGGWRGRTMARWLKLAALALAASLALPAGAPTAAQDVSPAPGRGESLPDTLEAIQQARVVTRVLYIVAHPDDET